ncbi:MAG: hypothetical protein HYV32_00725 [Candidatus Kerfeldbacteria bacterium]|nr:hypothetical protein [Candidatus Kerfeldbacteria bacterium]
MAQISEITVEDLLKHQRIDAEFFQPKFLDAERKVVSFSKKIQIKKVIHPNEFKRVYQENGLQILLAQNVRDNCLDFSTTMFADPVLKNDLKRNKVNYDDVLMTRSGANFGQTAVYKFENAEIYACADVLIIRSQEIAGGYLSTFLNSKYGKSLINRGVYGAAQPHIAPSYLYSLEVPQLNKEFEIKIDQITNDAFYKQEQSTSLYAQAQQLLLQELGLDDFTPEWVTGYEIDHDSVLGGARMDAEYFQPKYEIVKNKIRAVDHDTLGNLVKPLKKGIEVGSEAYAEEGIPFLRVSNIEKFRIDNSSEQYISKELYEELKDKFCPQKSEILLSKDGTPGIAYFLTEEVKTIISGGIVRLKSVEVEPEYLTLVLNSLIVQTQIEQDAGGALIKHWRPDQIKTTLIPILPKEVRAKIVAMVQESFSALHESRQLLKQAKRAVEEMIEAKASF